MLSTSRIFDVDMVRRHIERHGFDPVAREEPRAIKVGDVRVTIERYAWGRVFFAENRGHSLSLTWVEVGEDAPMLPSWARQVRAFVDRPGCLGHREPDHICDGGVNPETGEEERACVWRARCMVVQRLAGKPGNVPSVLEKFEDEDLARQAGERRRRKSGPRDPEVKKRNKRRGDATYTDSVEMVRSIVARVMELGGWTLASTRWRASANQFFLREYERRGRANYFALFRRIPTGEANGDARMPSIVMLYPHRSALRFSMQIRSEDLEFIQSVMPGHLTVRSGVYDHHHRHGEIVSVNRITDEEFEEVAVGLTRVIEERKFHPPGSTPAILNKNNPLPSWNQHSRRGKR